MKIDERKIAIYPRKSKTTGKGESIANQIEICKNFLKNNLNMELKDEDYVVYEDEDYTGANLNRPQFQLMMKDIEAGKIKMLVCYRLDRISRSVSDFSNLKDYLDDHDVKFVSVKEQFETATPGGRAMLMMTSVFAQFERDTIAERVRDNMLELSKMGYWLGGTTPLGYVTEKTTKTSANGKKTTLCKLVIDEKEIETVKTIYDKFIEFKTISKLETYLINNKIKTRKNKDFTRWSIKSILQNPTYVIADENIVKFYENQNIKVFMTDKINEKNGLLTYNKNITKGKNLVKNQKENWVISVSRHEGIIKGNVWLEIQDLLDKNGHTSFQPQKNKAILTGLIKCAECGGAMYPKIRTYTNDKGELRCDYICHNKYRSNGSLCNVKNVNGNVADELVINTIENLAQKNSKFRKAIEKIANDRLTKENSKADEISRLEFKIQKNQNEITSLLERISYIDVELLDDIQDKIKTLKKENEQLRKEINNINLGTPTKVNDKETAQIVLTLLDRYCKNFRTKDLATQKNMLRLLISSIISDGKRLTINIIGTQETENQDNINIDDNITNSKGGTIACSSRNDNVLMCDKSKSNFK